MEGVTAPDPAQYAETRAVTSAPRRYPGELTQSKWEYERLCEAVYSQGQKSCRKPGPHKAKCVLPPAHGGEWHEGNGFDEWGPMYQCWSNKHPRTSAQFDGSRGEHDA